MRIVIPAFSRGNAWLGGANYFLSLVRALRTYPCPDRSSVVLLSNQPEPFGEPNLNGVEITNAPWLDSMARPDYFFNGAANIIAQYNPRLYSIARSMRADLITHATPGRLAPCPILFWMQDFQHRHLPDYFSAYERWRRNRNVIAAAKKGHLLVSSHSAAADFRLFYPELSSTHVHVLPFAPLPGDETVSSDNRQILSKYRIQEGYFFLPNQFWRHKNHRIVIEALRLLPDSFRVVSTGAIADSRGSTHIRALLQTIDEYSLGERFRMLGVLPRHEMLSLLNQSVCVINPSLFEGWSTVVEEAKRSGKRLILSDIPVHREQNPEDALYFDPTDASALAIAMQKAAAEHDLYVEQNRIERATATLEGVVRNFALQYWRIAKIACADQETA